MAEKKSMLSVDEALNFLLSSARPISEVQVVSTLAAGSRVLAASQHARINVPSSDNSQMDGYAVRVADCLKPPTTLQVTQRIPAGQFGVVVEPHTTARIFTGAPIPSGADAVVMQEECLLEKNEEGEFITIRSVPQLGAWIRRLGEDIRAHSEILGAGIRLDAQALGLAASVGIGELPVVRRPRVALFCTGNELAMPGQALMPGQIYNSNRFILCSLLENLGCEVTDCGIVPDSLTATCDTLRQVCVQHDLIITTGGVSVGEEDYIKAAVESEGRLNMWQIAVKPGKPLAFGEIGGADNNSTAFFFGLPGNPVSSFVTFLLFVRPFILRLQGVQNVKPRSFAMRADFSWSKPDKRRELLRAKINAEGGLDLFPDQGSAVLTSTVWADGLIDNPPGNLINCGDMVRFIPFSELLH